MAIPGFPWLTEGLQVLLILLALIIVTIFLIRYLSFYSRYRKIRKENMALAMHMRKQLKFAKFKRSSNFDEEDDEMFQTAGRAKAPVVPASYEARIGKASRAAARRRKARAPRKARKRTRPGKAVQNAAS